MIMCIQNLVDFCPSVLKILSKNQFVTDINTRAYRQLRCKFAKNDALQYQHRSCQ